MNYRLPFKRYFLCSNVIVLLLLAPFAQAGETMNILVHFDPRSTETLLH